MQVKTRTQEKVYPVAPSACGAIVELSVLDQIAPRRYLSPLFFFSQEALPDTPALLKASLAETLSVFYPCAGRFRETSNGGLEIVCNDEGAVFCEAWVDRKFDDFLPHFDPHPDFALFVPKPETSAAISEIPLLFAQVTHFECGRICLGMRLHHCVCDAASLVHFLSTWATLTKSKANLDLHAEAAQLGLKPHIDRSVLVRKEAHEAPLSPSDHPEYQTQRPNLPMSQPPCTSKLFRFTPSSIDALRAKLSGSNVAHTRFEALAAHIWRGIIYARSVARDQEIRLGIAVDGRRRLKPALPEGYLGNVSFFGYNACAAGDLLERPPPFAADLVKDAIAKVTDAHMRSALHWVGKQEHPTSVIGSFFRPFIDVFFTSVWRVPFYEVDFGWGKPSFLRIPAFAYDGVVTMLPSPLGPGHVDVLVGLQVEQMHKFAEYIGEI